MIEDERLTFLPGASRVYREAPSAAQKKIDLLLVNALESVQEHIWVDLELYSPGVVELTLDEIDVLLIDSDGKCLSGQKREPDEPEPWMGYTPGEDTRPTRSGHDAFWG